MTDRIHMERGIFQGCHVSPYLFFLLVIEMMASAIRQNDNVKGFVVNNQEIKTSLLADDTVCFLDGSVKFFDNLFETLKVFSKLSGCKINLSKTEAIWIGSKRGCTNFPASEYGITWKTNQFKYLGIIFSLNRNLLFDLNYKKKLKQIEQLVNCWRMRNLSLIGKICVLKSLVLPQLLYLFSVLCIKIPQKFFKELNIFYRFIWNGGKDRVQRKLMCNDYSQCGLRMIDPYAYSLAQKMTWVKNLSDKNYDSTWKTIELDFLGKFHENNMILWTSHAPEVILRSLNNTQLAESLRTWYIFREGASKDIWGKKFSEIGVCQSLWFNENIRSKSKQYLYYDEWNAKNFCTVSDLLNPPFPGHKLFEELILDFDVSHKDRRKYNFLLKNIPNCWLETTNIKNTDYNAVDTIIEKLVQIKKVPRYAYYVIQDSCTPDKRYEFWKNIVTLPPDLNWKLVHDVNFWCSIDTRLRSFYFKIFHKSIALNDFLFKIKRKD